MKIYENSVTWKRICGHCISELRLNSNCINMLTQVRDKQLFVPIMPIKREINIRNFLHKGFFLGILRFRFRFFRTVSDCLRSAKKKQFANRSQTKNLISVWFLIIFFKTK